MATIREVSEAAGVSIATVSKVLNGKSGINAQTRALVLDTAKKLNYHPNMNARNLKSGSSRTIGIITEDLTVFNSPEIVDGIAATCDAENYHYILGNLRFFKRYGNGPMNAAESTSLVMDRINDMLSKQVDGIIYIGCHSHTVVPLCGNGNSKFVCAYCTNSDPTIPSVMYDDRAAAYAATQVLLKYGCKQIGMITGPIDSIHSSNRISGFQQALFDEQIPYNPHLTLTGDWTRDAGYKLAQTLVKQGVEAIFAHNDVMATGVLDYCNENNISVGNDIKVIGFDNREISSVCRPSLSTVSLPLFNIGTTATKVLLEMLNGKDHGNDQILLDCKIIERDSTKGTKHK